MMKKLVHFLYFIPIMLHAQPDSLHYYYDTSDLYTNQTVVLPTISVIGIEFENLQELIEFRKMQHTVNKVYPYYTDAIRLMEETDQILQGESKNRKKKRYVRQRKSELKGDYKKNLTQLSVTQGYILVKMIERKTGMTLYDIILKYQSSISAASWNILAKMNGYSLKEAYSPDEIKYLELILRSLENE